MLEEGEEEWLLSIKFGFRAAGVDYGNLRAVADLRGYVKVGRWLADAASGGGAARACVHPGRVREAPVCGEQDVREVSCTSRVPHASALY